MQLLKNPYCLLHCSPSKDSPSVEVDHQALDPVAPKPGGGLQEPLSGEPGDMDAVNEPLESSAQEKNLPNSSETHKDGGNGHCIPGGKKSLRQSQRGRGASKTGK
jgi:hypothetical protein